LADQLSGVALVTGGGRGIGAGIARELAGAGMKVAVSARTLEQVEAVAGEIGGLGVVADVSSPGDTEAMVAEVERGLGPIDLLVNNAGVAGWEAEPAWEADAAKWWNVFEVNLLGVYSAAAP
jgi:3-oxoacyl-[acyl-carrier protein] reductase